MRVVIGGKVYDSNYTPILLDLTASDRKNIEMMAPEARLYFSYPDHYGEVKGRETMDVYKKVLEGFECPECGGEGVISGSIPKSAFGPRIRCDRCAGDGWINEVTREP